MVTEGVIEGEEGDSICLVCQSGGLRDRQGSCQVSKRNEFHFIIYLVSVYFNMSYEAQSVNEILMVDTLLLHIYFPLFILC